MGEDCHDSNNGRRERDADMEIMLPCTECGELLLAFEAYPVDISHLDGTSEIALFHRDYTKMCALKWAMKRLDAAGKKLREILDLFENI